MEKILSGTTTRQKKVVGNPTTLMKTVATELLKSRPFLLYSAPISYFWYNSHVSHTSGVCVTSVEER